MLHVLHRLFTPVRHLLGAALLLGAGVAGPGSALLPAADDLLPGTFVKLDTIGTLRDSSKVQLHVPPAATPPTTPANLKQWETVPTIQLGDKRTGAAPAGADSSATVRLQWDADNLYCLIEVADDVFAAPAKGGEVWTNDCCQIAFDSFYNGPKGSYDPQDLGFTISATPDGPVVMQSRSRGEIEENPHPVKPVQLAITARPDGLREYSVALSWASLAPVSPFVLGHCGFNVSINDNDGTGFKKATQWTPGIAHGKDISQFGELIFDGAQASQSASLEPPTETRPAAATNASGRWLKLNGIDGFDRATLVVAAHEAVTATATLKVYRPGKAEVVAQNTITQTLNASSLGAFTWDLAHLPNGQYELEIERPFNGGVSARQPYARVDIAKIVAQTAALREQFGLDRPWDDMATAAPLIRRHRGFVAAGLDWIQDNSALDKNPGGRMFALLQYTAMLDAVAAGQDYLSTQRGAFVAGYYSPIDGSGQPLVITLPEHYDPNKRYPALIWLHGSGGRPLPGNIGKVDGDYIRIDPWGRGDTGYKGFGESDVFEALRYVQTWYPLDPDKLYLAGSSMGGTGTWRIGSHYADRFAAISPDCGGGYGNLLENLRNVPVYNQHGTADFTVPIDYSRLAALWLAQAGYPVVHREWPGLDHEVPPMADADAWLLSHTRQSAPRLVTLTSETPAYATAYWLAVRSATDIHRQAVVQAQVDSAANSQSLSVHLDNVAVLEFNLAQAPLNRQQPLLLQAEAQLIQLPAPLPERLFLLHGKDGFTTATEWTPPVTAVRKYQPGAGSNLSAGEPLLFIYGTSGDAERTETLKAAATQLAHGRMATGGILVRADSTITADDLSHFNVVLFGSDKENTLTQKVLAQLPVRFDDQHRLIAGDRSPVSLEGAGWKLFYYNPLSPQHWLYVLACDAPTADAVRWYGREDIAGMTSGPNGDTADLIVSSVAGPIRRRMQFDPGWVWRTPPGADQPIPAAATSDRAFVQASLATLAKLAATTGADFALTPDGSDKQLYEADTCTRADVAIEQTPGSSALATLTGAELIELLQTKKYSVIPAVAVAGLNPARAYRVIGAPLTLLGLVRRWGRNLKDPAPGPAWDRQDPVNQLFARP